MEKTTAELASELSRAKDFDLFKQNNAGEFKTPTPMDYLLELLNAKNIKHTDATGKANISDSYGRRLFNGTLAPGRDHLLRYALAGNLTFDETQTLLKYGKHAALYARDQRDQVIIFAIQRHKSALEANIMLQDLGLTPLFNSKE
jgi:hypothetical protein